jgi:CO/xanthine dehydrogenase Mo-binding subunit
MARPAAVGQALRRFDGAEKVTGATQYVEDLQLPRLAFARLVLSPHAHARIKAFDLEAARAHPGVVDVVTAADLALHYPNPASRADMVLARDEVLFVGQPVAVVVAETEAAATDAAQLVSVDYELLPAVVDVRQAMRAEAPLTRTGSLSPDSAEAAAHGAAVESATVEAKPRNVHTVSRFQRGDVEAGFREADAMVQATYELAPVHQGFLETHATLAALEPDGGVRIWTATQGIFYARNETARLLGLPQHQVRVVPMAVGGGFGGKIVLIEPLVALLARRLRRPVRLTYTRTEEFLAGVPGPGAIIELKIGGRRDGSLTAVEARIHFDSGPCPSGPTGIAAILIGGTYRIPHLDLVAYDVLTHRQPGGAYRAPGAPQAFFALESAIDALARQLQLDPLEFRLRNAAGEGDLRPDGKAWPALGLQECLRQLQRHRLWTGRSRRPHEGYGLAVGGWGGGIEPAAAACRVNSDGTLTVQVGSVDISGTDTALAAIAADAFGLSTSQVRIAHGDSDQVPYAGIAGGSKITYVVGPAVLMAAEDARRQVLAIAAEHLEAAPADLLLEDGRVFVRGVPTRSVSVGEIAGMSMQFAGHYIPVYGRGQTVIQEQSPIFGAHLAHVRVDPESGRVQVLNYLAVHDVGRAVNPPEVLGQIHGGVVQGLGRALFEQLAYGEDGQLLSTNFADYILPTSTDVPAITVQLVEVPSKVGAYGAKGVGEPPCIPVAAAIANAVADATGGVITTAPMTPGVVRGALERRPNPAREEAFAD